MGIFDFLFKKPSEMEDIFFGKLLFMNTEEPYFEGKKYFLPSKQDIELTIDGDLEGPSIAQKKFFKTLEESYEQLILKIEPIIINEFRNWIPDFKIKDFQSEFTPTHISIPIIISSLSIVWEIVFETIHDKNHSLTISFKDFEPTHILIDG